MANLTCYANSEMQLDNPRDNPEELSPDLESIVKDISHFLGIDLDVSAVRGKLLLDTLGAHILEKLKADRFSYNARLACREIGKVAGIHLVPEYVALQAEATAVTSLEEFEAVYERIIELGNKIIYQSFQVYDTIDKALRDLLRDEPEAEKEEKIISIDQLKIYADGKGWEFPDDIEKSGQISVSDLLMLMENELIPRSRDYWDSYLDNDFKYRNKIRSDFSLLRQGKFDFDRKLRGFNSENVETGTGCLARLKDTSESSGGLGIGVLEDVEGGWNYGFVNAGFSVPVERKSVECVERCFYGDSLCRVVVTVPGGDCLAGVVKQSRKKPERKKGEWFPFFIYEDCVVEAEYRVVDNQLEPIEPKTITAKRWDLRLCDEKDGMPITPDFEERDLEESLLEELPALSLVRSFGSLDDEQGAVKNFINSFLSFREDFVLPGLGSSSEISDELKQLYAWGVVPLSELSEEEKQFHLSYAFRSKQINEILNELTREYCATKCRAPPIGCCDGNHNQSSTIHSGLQYYEAEEVKLEDSGKITDMRCQYHTSSGCKLEYFKSPLCLGHLCFRIKRHLEAKYGQFKSLPIVKEFDEKMVEVQFSNSAKDSFYVLECMDAAIAAGRKLVEYKRGL